MEFDSERFVNCSDWTAQDDGPTCRMGFQNVEAIGESKRHDGLNFVGICAMGF
jgi:hypothetical protein